MRDEPPPLQDELDKLDAKYSDTTTNTLILPLLIPVVILIWSLFTNYNDSVVTLLNATTMLGYSISLTTSIRHDVKWSDFAPAKLKYEINSSLFSLFFAGQFISLGIIVWDSLNLIPTIPTSASLTLSGIIMLVTIIRWLGINRILKALERVEVENAYITPDISRLDGDNHRDISDLHDSTDSTDTEIPTQKSDDKSNE